MSSLEKIHMLWQTVQNMEGLRINILDNAAAYKAQVGIQTPTEISAVMVADSGQYLRRLAWQKTIKDDPIKYQKLIDVFGFWGISEQDLLDDYAALKSAADYQATVQATDIDIITKADNILTSVLAHDSVW